MRSSQKSIEPDPAARAGPPWWEGIRSRASRGPDGERVDLRIDDRVVGSIARPLVAQIRQAGLPLTAGSDDGPVRLADDASAALREIAEWLRARGHAGRWRDELLAVRAAPDGPVLAVVERGVARNLGIPTQAVQLHARQPETGRWWLQLRALDKATDPGKWDTVTGGLVAAEESVSQALARESWEEAGVRVALLSRPPRDAGRFTVRRPVQDAGSHGYLVETVFAFTCDLAAGQRPANQDGEVLRFETFSDEEIDALVRTGDLTLEAAVAVALCRGSGTSRCGTASSAAGRWPGGSLHE